MTGSTIFVVDSSPAVRRMVEQFSTPKGFRVIGFPDGPSALDAARNESPALIIADFHLANMTFSGFCKEVGRQDNLAETLLISIVNASDRLDEGTLRALGVQAVLKKPFRSEQLLDTINGILNGAPGTPDGRKSAKARTWPPVSTVIDDGDDDPPRTVAAASAIRDETEKEATSMASLPADTTPPTPTNPAQAPVSGEAMMKGLFEHLVQSVALQTDRDLSERLPEAVTRAVTEQVGMAVRAAVQREVSRQLAEALAPERIRTAMRDLILDELGRQAPAYRAGVETTIRQTVSDMAPAILERSAVERLGDLAETGVKKHLPEALQAHLQMVQQLVKEEVGQVAATCARQAAEEIVHEMAQDPIQQAVRRIVPEMADTQIRAEIKRLSSAA